MELKPLHRRPQAFSPTLTTSSLSSGLSWSSDSSEGNTASTVTPLLLLLRQQSKTTMLLFSVLFSAFLAFTTLHLITSFQTNNFRFPPPHSEIVVKYIGDVNADASIENIFVLGLEGSGTRFVSRSIALAFDDRNMWNGEFPPCWNGPTSTNTQSSINPIAPSVQHISLPFGSILTPNSEFPKLYKNVDLCDPRMYNRKTGLRNRDEVDETSSKRWFMDVDSALSADPKSVAIFVNRDEGATFRSKIKKHSVSHNQLEEKKKQYMIDMAQEEMKWGIEIMETALRNHRQRIYVLDYEQLGLPSTWISLYDFLVSNGFPLKVDAMPTFKNGNAKYQN
ncbi:hypothetical protein TrLO_g9492 [Triparma laevis f. longispina]|uniref:Sulfotransferase domain-containing protein n=1 Tax=Triparma laevis f. longispina TaxID=1714387 RepID=A0A9W6ZDT1_9STRA|nr:hypothetical protein TrLO_g9492 [Triparma laevis f. longispina]